MSAARFICSRQYNTSAEVPRSTGPNKDLYSIDELLARLPESDRQNIFVIGGFLLIEVNWDCNVDHETPDESYVPCVITPKVSRLDPNTGYNYNGAHYPDSVDAEGALAANDSVLLRRDLVKKYGIRIHIVTPGKGYKFSIIRCWRAV